MTTILSHGRVCDGYDVRCLSDTLGRFTVHLLFPLEGEALQARCDAVEAERIALTAEPDFEIIGEDE